MKTKNILNKTIVGAMLFSTMILPIVETTTAFASETDVEMVAEQADEITQINVSYKSSLKLSYGESKEYYYNLILDTFEFKDQNGNSIDRDLLDIVLTFHDKGTHYFDFDEFYELYAFSPNTVLNSRVGLKATLKSNPSVSGTQKVNGADGLGIWIINKSPEISTLVDNPTVYEGTIYKEWENVVFSDFEDDRDNFPLQKSVVYPENFNKNNMQSGEYQVIYRVTDSRGATSETIERLTVAPTFAPEIEVNDMTVKAENREFNPLTESNVTVTDSLDDNPSLEVVENNVNLKKEGEYQVKFRANNKFNKQSEKTMTVKVVADNPILNVKDTTFNSNQSQSDIVDILEANANDLVDGDLTNSIKVIENDIDWTKNGRYTVKLEVTNSNNKTTQVSVNVRVDIKYTLTIDYVDSEGNTLADSKEIVLNQGTKIIEEALEIEGYKVDKETITTTLDKDRNIKFVYSVVEVPTEPTEPQEPEVPTEPEVPVEPQEPTEPTTPVKPVEPTKPQEPQTPVEPTEPQTPEVSVEPQGNEKTEDTLYQTNADTNKGLITILITLAVTAVSSLLFIVFKKKKQ
ncbi:MucBP domain-containing protein [Enterococcus faecalis]|uniref:MucBP domain-containing protein n=1 Tax=Enterococcus faecalis TaxID=1351 RepID=UPI0039847CC1